MKDHKIVFSDAPVAGKTAAIAAWSDEPLVLTEVNNTDPHRCSEPTPVGLGFSQLDLGDGQRIRSFGTPGQVRFEFMWRIVAADAPGLVILVDNANPNPVADFPIYLDAYSKLLATMNWSVGIGRTAESPRRKSAHIADATQVRR